MKSWSTARQRNWDSIPSGSTAFWIDPEREVTFSFLSTGLMEDSYHIERVSRLSDIMLAAITR